MEPPKKKFALDLGSVKLKKVEKKKVTKKTRTKLDLTNAKTLFVIDFQIDWFDVFQGVSLADGTPVKVKKTKSLFFFCPPAIYFLGCDLFFSFSYPIC